MGSAVEEWEVTHLIYSPIYSVVEWEAWEYGWSATKRKVKGKDRVEYLDIDLFDFTCNTVSFNYSKNVICSDCKGSGGKYPSSVVKCEICNGTGMIMKVVQVGPGMITQTQSPCNACNRKGTQN